MRLYSMRHLEQGSTAVVLFMAAWLTVSGIATAEKAMRSSAMNVVSVSNSGSLLRDTTTTAVSSSPIHNITDPFAQLEMYRNFRAQAQKERKHRLKDRRLKAKQVFQKLPKAPAGNIERVSEEEWKEIDAKQKRRGLNWFGDSTSSTGNAYSKLVLVDPSAYYDKWAQAYRMLGGFIDCDHTKSENSHDNGDGGNANGACSRWMMRYVFS
jgi:hypothetical protein